MITKKQFVSAINAILTQQKKDSRIAKFFESEMTDSWFMCKYNADITNGMIELLQASMNDTENSWIEWWLYDCCNDDKRVGKCSIDNKQYIIKTPSQLYDLIVDWHKKHV